MATFSPKSPGQNVPSEPTTPDAGLRNRNRTSQPSPGDVSPTSTQATSIPVERIPQSLFQRGALLSTTTSMPLIPAPRRILIRADPALVTCFDPSDKELYDLWAPKR